MGENLVGRTVEVPSDGIEPVVEKFCEILEECVQTTIVHSAVTQCR